MQWAARRAKARASKVQEGTIVDGFAVAIVEELERRWGKGVEPAESVEEGAMQKLDDALTATMEGIGRGGQLQVVLVSAGMEARGMRVAWPRGTSVFDVAPRESHEVTRAALRSLGAKMDSGRALVRVPYEHGEGEELLEGMEQRGYSGERKSLWVLEGVEASEWVWLEMEKAAASGSEAVGMCPRGTGEWLKRLAAEHGWLLYGEAAVTDSYSLFRAEKRNPSLAQRSTYLRELSLAEEEGDEDTFEDFW